MQTKPEGKNKSTTIVGIILLAVLVGFTMYALKDQNDTFKSLTKSNDLLLASTKTQAGLYENLKVLYHKSEAEVALLNKELQSTQEALNQTQEFLAQAREMNTTLENQLASVSQTSLNTTIQQLKAEQSKAIKELAGLKEILKAYQATEINNPQEAKAMIDLFKAKLQMVKVRLNDLKREANLARLAVKKEQDRLAFLNGNRGTLAEGFLVKDGELNVAQEKPSQEDKVKTVAVKKVNIDVQFLEK